MSYGLEITTPEGFQVLDENNQIMVVAEKGTISGTRSTPYGPGDANVDSNGKWLRVRTNLGTSTQPEYITNGYRSYEVLSANYGDKFLVAVRGANGTITVTPFIYGYSNGTGNSVIFFQKDSPSSIDWLVLVPANQTTPTVNGGNYGMQLLDASNNVLLDTRWEELFALKKVESFPVISSSHNYRTGGIPTGTTVNISNGDQGDFYCLTNTFGFQNAKIWDDYQEGFHMYHYGGVFYPALQTTSDGLSVIPTMVRKFYDETNTTQTESASGGITSFSPTGGDFMILRYLNF
jgi:hypothetical protein